MLYPGCPGPGWSARLVVLGKWTKSECVKQAVVTAQGQKGAQQPAASPVGLPEGPLGMIAAGGTPGQTPASVPFRVAPGTGPLRGRGWPCPRGWDVEPGDSLQEREAAGWWVPGVTLTTELAVASLGGGCARDPWA